MSSDTEKGQQAFRLAAFGLLSMAVAGSSGSVAGWRSGSKFCKLALETTTINHAERSLLYRYTFSPELKTRSRLALFNVLAGPIIMLGRHALHKTCTDEKDMDLGMSMFVDFMMIPVGCSALSYSFMYLAVFMNRARLGLGMEVIRRIF